MSDSTLRGANEDNLLTLLIWNPEHCEMLAAILPPELFGSSVHQRVASAAIDYINKYHQPPGVHIRDLLERELARRTGQSTMYANLIDASEKLAPALQPEYVLAELDKWIRVRRKLIAIEEAQTLLQNGEEDEADQVLDKARSYNYTDTNGDKLTDPWGEPQPPPFDPDVLPHWLRDFVKDRARVTGFDPAGFAWGALSTCSAALDGSVRIQMKRHDRSWLLPPGVWTLLLGDPSSGRTPILQQCWAPLQKIQNEWFEDWKPKWAAWKAADKENRGDEPRPLRLCTTDPTIESLQTILANQDRGIAQIRDEWSGFIGSLDSYTSGKGNALNRAFYLQSYDGGPYTVDRVDKGRGLVHIHNNHVVICGGIQPERLRELGNLQSDGLLQRDVVIAVRQKHGGEDAPSNNRSVDNYDFLVSRLAKLPGNRIVTLSGEALAVREDVEALVGPLTKNDTLGMGFRTFCGKLIGIWGRLTLVLGHIIQSTPTNEPPTEIGFEAADIARKLVFDCVLPHAVQFHSWLGGGSNAEMTKSIAGYILTKKLTRIVPTTLTNNVRECRNFRIDEVQKALSPLLAMDWLRPDTRHSSFQSGNAKAWVVNPVVHVQFAERARLEKARREQLQEIMQRAFRQQRPVLTTEYDKKAYAREEEIARAPAALRPVRHAPSRGRKQVVDSSEDDATPQNLGSNEDIGEEATSQNLGSDGEIPDSYIDKKEEAPIPLVHNPFCHIPVPERVHSVGILIASGRERKPLADNTPTPSSIIAKRAAVDPWAKWWRDPAFVRQRQEQTKRRAEADAIWAEDEVP